MNPVDLVYWTVGKGILGTCHRAVMVSLRSYGTERMPREGGARPRREPLRLHRRARRRHRSARAGSSSSRRASSSTQPGLSQLIRAHGTLAVRRGESDRDALRRMREAVRERTRCSGSSSRARARRAACPGEAKPGAAMIAIQEGVPVVPAAVHGSQAWKVGNRAPVSIAFGEPMRFAEQPAELEGLRGRDGGDPGGDLPALGSSSFACTSSGGRRARVPPRREKVPARVS